MSDRSAKDPRGHPWSGHSTTYSVRVQPGSARHLETTQRRYRSLSTAGNAASSLLRGPHRLSRRLSRPQSTRFGPGDPESAMSANDQPLGDEPLDRAHTISPAAPGLSPAPGAVFPWLALDERCQYRLRQRHDRGRPGARRPSPAPPPGGSRPRAGAVSRGVGGRVLDG